MRKCTILLLIILLCIPTFVYAEDSGSGSDSGGIFDFSFFDPVLEFIETIKEIILNVIELGKLVGTEIIPAFVKLIQAIFGYFKKLFDFLASFINVPAIPISGSVMSGVSYVTNFNIGGVGIKQIVLSMLILFLSLRLVKRFVL